MTAQGTMRRVIAAGHLDLEHDGAIVLTGHLIDLTGQFLDRPDTRGLDSCAAADVEGTAARWSIHGLTQRETQVLLLIARGHTNEEMGLLHG